MPVDVVDEPENARFAVHIAEAVAQLEYRRRGDRLLLIHTEVPAELEGRGIGSRLVRAAVDEAQRHGLTLVPHCRFANAWLRRHPDAVEGVAIAWPPHRESA